jgi:phospholipid N-methyltransferase
MLDMADVPGAGLVVELGAGTGVTTGEVLARMKPDARLIALEIDPQLVRLMQERFPDPRLQVVCDSAEHIEKYLEGAEADVLVCALPFTSLDKGLRRRLLGLLPVTLAPTGTAVVIQYSPLIERELRKLFPSVRRRISPRNVPPAFLYACSLEPGAG